jgi:hypothetical protein
MKIQLTDDSLLIEFLSVIVPAAGPAGWEEEEEQGRTLVHPLGRKTD